MGTQTIGSSDASIKVQQKILQKNSQHTVTGTEELMGTIDIKIDKWTAAHAHVKQTTIAASKIGVASETAIIESTPKTAIISGQYVRDNVWNWS